MKGSNVRTSALLCLLTGGCAIAFAPIFVRFSDTGPVASAFWRTALAAPILWIWAWRTSSIGETRMFAPLVGAGLFFAGDLAVWHWAVVYTSVANATLLANLAPIFVTTAGWWLFGQRVTRTFLVGMIAAIAGMFVLVGPNFASGGLRWWGDLLGACSAVFYAGYMLTVKSARDAGISTVRLMAWSTTLTAVALLPLALVFPQPMLPSSGRGWLVLFGLALVNQVTGQGLIAYAFAHLPASLSSVSLLIQPVMAALFAWGLLGESVGWSATIGGTIVLAAIWVARKGSRV